MAKHESAVCPPKVLREIRNHKTLDPALLPLAHEAHRLTSAQLPVQVAQRTEAEASDVVVTPSDELAARRAARNAG